MYILILSYKNTTKTQIFVASKVQYIFKEYSFYLKSMCHVVQVSILSCNKYLFITGTKCENTRAFITADIRKDIFNGRTHLFNFRFDNSRCVSIFFFTHERYIPCSFDKIGWPEKNVLKLLNSILRKLSYITNYLCYHNITSYT